jgi:hypothetical protein
VDVMSAGISRTVIKVDDIFIYEDQYEAVKKKKH